MPSHVRTPHVVVLLALTLSGCGSASLTGRYYSDERRGEWLEFDRLGTVVHGASGDAIPYRLEGDAVLLLHPDGTITGRKTSPSTIQFGPDADAFAGAWVAPAVAGPIVEAAEAEKRRAALGGRWRIQDDATVLEFLPDGSYTLGQDITGTYQVLDADRIQMSVLQRGQMLNPALVQRYEVVDGLLHLTMPDGSVTIYERPE